MTETSQIMLIVLAVINISQKKWKDYGRIGDAK